MVILRLLYKKEAHEVQENIVRVSSLKYLYSSIFSDTSFDFS
jgi:hypothetical protein